MAGLPSQRDGLAAGTRDRCAGPHPPAALITVESAAASRIRPGFTGALALLLSLVLLTATLARAALAAAAPGQVAATFAFGGVLLTLWAAAHLTGAVRFPVDLDLRPRSLVAGVAVAAVLLAPGLWLRATGHPTRLDIFGPGFYLPLVPALLWIAPAEELFLRGLLQPAIRQAAGPGCAIAVAAVLFAAIHLPAYGWGAMPLDLGVGLLIGWLREELRSVTACVAAHTLADLGAWFLA